MTTQISAVWTQDRLVQKPYPSGILPADPCYLARLTLPQQPSEGFQLSQSGPPPPGPSYNGETTYLWQQTRRITTEGLHVIQLDEKRDVEGGEMGGEKNRLRLFIVSWSWKWVVCGILCLCIALGLCVGIPVYLHQKHRGNSSTHADADAGLKPRHIATALTTASLLAIAPTANTCAGAAYPLECRTASQALAPILASFETYNITTPATQAAILSTIALESGEFKFSHHYFPTTVPGQGTRNMQSAKYNLEYAQSIPELAGESEMAKAKGAEAVVDLLVAKEEWDFGSTAWFLTTRCEEGVVRGLENGKDGFGPYLGCIGTEENEQRRDYYEKALKTFGVQ